MPRSSASSGGWRARKLLYVAEHSGRAAVGDAAQSRDIDASDVPLHGAQELSQFHAYYDHHCYLPLYVFCGQAMLACVLRPSKIDGARHAAAVVKLLVMRLRRVWPATRFIVRADSGFCRRRLLQWCERAGVGYIVGLARNARLHAAVEVAEACLADTYKASGTKQRLIGEFSYAAKSWRHERRVITRLEYGDQGTNPRFVVTNLEGDPDALYDGLYCQRGEAENRIKEAQLDLFGTRASCSRFIANQFRLLLAALAYTLMQRLRALALQGSELRARQCRDDPRAAAEDRRGDPAQHASRARDAGQPPPLARVVRHGRRAAERAQPVATHPVPGPRVDIKKARIPSRGRGRHALRLATTGLLRNKGLSPGLWRPKTDSIGPPPSSSTRLVKHPG